MLPQEFLNRMKAQLGPEFDAFLAAYDRPRALGLRVNPLKCDTLPALPFSLEPVPWARWGFTYPEGQRPGLHPWHEAGVYYLQEPSAMAPASLLAPRPGERVLDLCAAPGGKSTQLAAAMEGQGLLVCNEVQPKRAKILAQNIERMGIANALVLNETPQNLARRFPGWFHRVLVDAPCSGEGMFRKEQAALTDWSPDYVALCARRQGEILADAARMLAPGGRLVYSTCTFSPQENEGVISEFLHRHPDFSVETVEAPWFSPGCPGGLDHPAAGLAHTFRLWPHRLKGEGHYAAVLRRDGGEEDRPELQRPSQLPREITEFLREQELTLPRSGAIAFGETWFLLPEQTPELQGLRVLRPGLELGSCRAGRFVPAHALALWAKPGANSLHLDPDGPEIAGYLAGEVLPGDKSGWIRICAGAYSLGWAKGAGGALKNHYPKGLRRRGGR